MRQNRVSVLKRVFRYTLTVAGVLLGLLILMWGILLWYVNANEKKIIARISEMIKKRTHGDVKIGALSVSFFRTFPILSLQLKDVVLKDSLVSRHGMNLLDASDVYLRASLRGLLTRNEPVGKVVIRNGNVNLLTDSSGRTNEYVLKSDRRREAHNGTFSMPDIVLKNVAVRLRNLERKKLYHAVVRTLHCSGDQGKDQIEFELNFNLLVRAVAFNEDMGAYLENKPVSGKFELYYRTDTKDLLLKKIKLYLDGHPFLFEGQFSVDKKASDFSLLISTRNIDYAKATSLLRAPLRKKMDDYTVSRPIDFQVKVTGQTAARAQPLVEAFVDVKKSEVGTPLGTFDECSFKGIYKNEVVKGERRNDRNSIIHFMDFSGKWEEIKVSSKNIRITDLITPFLDCDLVSDVDMKSLNSLTGSRSFQFLGGKSAVNVHFRGPLTGNDSTGSKLNGEIKITNASIKYLPRNFVLNKLGGTLKFVDNDFEAHKVVATAGRTELRMNGKAKNFLSVLNISPEKGVLEWNITSPSLHLEDFKGFLSKSALQDNESTTKAKFGATTSKVDKMFAEGDTYISLRAPEMDYKTFKANDVKADVVLKPTEITFSKVELNHAGGSMKVNGSLRNGDRYNPVVLQAEMRNMDIPQLFSAFGNFGQDAITHENLKGKLSANVNFSTAIDNEAKLHSDANNGSVRFLLQDGELNNFEPLREISNKAFKKQDFSNIRFADLENRLDIRGTAFIINRMDIRSTALNLTVEGVYDFKKGTDMGIRLPLTNVVKSQADTDITDEGKAKKGVSLRLRAKTAEDGKLKISWDPLRLAKKNKKEVEDSAEERKME